MTKTTDFAAPRADLVPAATAAAAAGPRIGSIPAAALEHAPVLVAMFKEPSLELVYLNATGRRWIDPRGDAEAVALDLPSLVGVSSLNRLHSSILPQAGVLGGWAGDCDLRDVWGSEFAVRATFSHADSPLAGHPPWLCLAAVRTDGIGADDSVLGDRELLHALLDTIPEAVYFKDHLSRMIRVSRSMAQKMGLSDPSAMIGHTDFDFFAISHAQPAYDDEQRIIGDGRPIIDAEEKEVWPDGRVTWVSTTKLPLRNRSGTVVGTFGVSRDITARKLAEEKRRELETQLQLAQKLESVGRLAAGIAHEINTPTQFIADNTHFLLGAFDKLAGAIAAYRSAITDAKPAAPAPALEAVAAAEEAADLAYLLEEVPRALRQNLDGLGRVGAIVRSLKEFSHPQNAQRTAANLNHAIENAIIVSKHEWKYVAHVVTEFDPSAPAVPCILDEFNQVMLNLIVNAAHAIASAQKAAGTTELGAITLRTSHDDKAAFVEVADTGTGIPEAIRDRIFEPFFTTKEVGKGSGQGLMMVRTIIVKHHGGTVDFTSETGRGTTFRLRLPLESPV